MANERTNANECFFMASNQSKTFEVKENNQVAKANLVRIGNYIYYKTLCWFEKFICNQHQHKTYIQIHLETDWEKEWITKKEWKLINWFCLNRELIKSSSCYDDLTISANSNQMPAKIIHSRLKLAVYCQRLPI